MRLYVTVILSGGRAKTDSVWEGYAHLSEHYSKLISSKIQSQVGFLVEFPEWKQIKLGWKWNLNWMVIETVGFFFVFFQK